MKLRLERTWPLGARTIGRLYINDVWEAYTCEDQIRLGPKVYGETAIPAGTYRVVLSYSEKFKRTMLEIVGVPGFGGIRFHAGHDEADTLGCVILGHTKDAAGVYESKVAVKQFEPKVIAALKSGDVVTIEIVNVAPEAIELVAA